MRVRAVSCPSCGAPKITAPKTAYVYCDYCGRFMDFDMGRAKYANGKAAGPHYRALVQKLQDEMAAAREANDMAALSACHRQLYEQYMNDLPDAHSPRIGDPEYRKAFLDRTVFATVTCETDPVVRAAQEKVNAAVQALDWDTNFKTGKSLCKPHTFWRMFDAEVERATAARKALPESVYPCPDPDETPDELSAKMHSSVLAQGWVAFLDEETGDELLRRAGVTSEYRDIEKPPLVDVPCTNCHTTRAIPHGATKGVCESCGWMVVVGALMPCAHCGGQLTVPLGHASTECPFCHQVSDVITYR